MRKTLLSILLFTLFCSSAIAQNISVNGTVKDASGATLIGVNVVVKGQSSGTITDFEGNYSLSVPSNSTLVFSYIGYTQQEIYVKNQKTINVILVEESLDLEEVIVVGSVMRKSDLTGAVGSVSEKVLSERPVTNINQAIQGRVAGVLVNTDSKPGGDASIRIRGVNTINGSTEPIYVVDGLIMDNFGGGFNAVNVNDVSSVEILKDASATALYGSRAANGVVLITTKKGSKGQGKVNYDGWVGVRSYANMPTLMNSKQLSQLRIDAATNGFKATNPNYTSDDLENFLQTRVYTAYDPNQAGGGFVFAQYELDALNDPSFQDYDWLGAVTRNGIEHNHAVNFSGGNEQGSYFLSFGYSNVEGLVKNMSDEKYTGRINADYNIKKWLKVGTNTTYTHSQAEIHSNDAVFDAARGANVMLPISDTLMVLNYAGYYDQNYFNPLGTLRIENDRTRDRLLSSNYINVNPIKGLNIRSTFALDLLSESRFSYAPNDIQQAIRYTHYGEASHTRDQRLVWQWDNTISYDNRFGKHRVNALVGMSAIRNDRNYTTVTGRGYDTNLFSYYNLGASNQLANRSIGSDFSTSTLLSYFVRANYDYDGKYFVTATTRFDGSSKFAKGYKWGVFPSLSAAWDIAQENFMQSQNVIDQLKIRAGFGLVGNQDISNFAYLTTYYASVTEGETTYQSSSQRGTSDISWESQQQFNLGVDAAFLKSRLRLSVDLFNIDNKDLLMTRTVNTSSGFSTAVVNVGSINNKGVEVTIGATAIKTRDFEWNISANFSSDKNKVTSLYDNNEYILNYDADRNLQKTGNLFIGESRNTIYIWKTGGIAQEEDMERLNNIDWGGRQVNPGDLYPEDINEDGRIDDKDRVIVGSSDPLFYGGFSTDFNWKGISLSAVFNYSYGAKQISYLYESMIGSTGKSIASVDLLDRWTPDNTSAKFPRVITNDPLSGTSYNTFSASNMDHSVQDGSYLRLSNLTLSYTLPQKVLSAIKFSDLRVYVTGTNLFCITPYGGYDPESGDWYPPTRMFTVGLNVTF